MVALVRNDYLVLMSVGTRGFRVNDTSYSLDVPAQIINGRTMLPIRALVESVGYSVGWDAATSTVVILTSQSAPQIPQAQVQSGGVPVRGAWNGNVYVNEYLGLRFTAPEGWIIGSDEFIAETTGRLNNLVGAGLPLTEEMWNGTDFVDMTTGSGTGITVQVLYRRLQPPYSEMTTMEYLQVIMAYDMENETFLASGLGSREEIGNYQWWTYFPVFNISGTNLYFRQFVNLHNGYVRFININMHGITEALHFQNPRPSPI
jgi:hypothetical protein